MCPLVTATVLRAPPVCVQDLRKCGCTLAQILDAGQWKSSAFMHYIDEVGATLGHRIGVIVFACRQASRRTPPLRPRLQAMKKSGLTSFASTGPVLSHGLLYPVNLVNTRAISVFNGFK